MTRSLTTTPTEMAETGFRPGHTVILQPSEGPCSVACTCGGLLEPTLGAKKAQLARFLAHLEETAREDTHPSTPTGASYAPCWPTETGGRQGLLSILRVQAGQPETETTPTH